MINVNSTSKFELPTAILVRRNKKFLANVSIMWVACIRLL